MTASPRPDDPSVLDASVVARALGADLANGLTGAEAARRLAVEGPNELRAAPPVSAWKRFLAQFRDPLIYLLLAAIAISLVANWLGGGGVPVDAIVIGVILLLNAGLGFAQEAKARGAVAALARLSAVTSSVMRDGRPLRVPSAQLVPGDLLVLDAGDAVGADARLVETASLYVQEASLTGESEAVLKDAATLGSPAALGDRASMVFKGTAVAQGTGRAIVTATGMRTEMGAIAAMMEATPEQPTPLELEVHRIGRLLGITVVAIVLVVVGALLLVSQARGPEDVITILLFGVSLAVAAVPEGLPAILSLVLALGVQRMAKHKAIVKDLSSVETLGSASVICTDKTGTLTRAEMTIQRIVTASGTAEVTGVGYEPRGRVERDGEPVRGDQLAEAIVVLSGGSVASNADLRHGEQGGWEVLGDPTEAAFLVAERKLGADERRQRRFERLRVLPFTSERKMMSVIARDHERADEVVLISKGAPDVLVGRCNRVREGGQVVALDEARRRRILAGVDALSGEALRTLAVAYRPISPGEEGMRDPASLERELVFAGLVGIADPPREEVESAIREARDAGIRVIMITGDHPRTAARIAAGLRIAGDGEQVLTGRDLDALDENAFAAAVREVPVYARVAPRHKLKIIGALQSAGHIVAMTGDGVNDAPALKAADIGVAMGIAGTEVAKEAARMILADDNFATIVAAVREGRSIFANIRKFLRYLLSSNMGEVLTVFLGVVFAGALGLADAGSAFVLPLLATQILWINLITDSGPALAMGMEPPPAGVMARPPRRLNDRVMDANLWFGVLRTGAVMAVVTLATIDLYLPGGFFAGERDLANARTAGFTVLVLAQLFNCFNARAGEGSALDGMFGNPWLWGAVTLSALLQVAVVHVPLLNVAFGTVPLSGGQWLLCVAMASVVLWVREAQKWLGRRAGGVGATRLM